MSGWTLTFQVVNFLVLAALLRRFLFKPIMAMVAKRQQAIAKVTADGDRARKDLEALHSKAEVAAADLDRERTRMRAETTSSVDRDRQAALVEAHREADAVREKGRRDLESEREKAADAMAQGAVDLGTAVARKLLEQVSSASIALPFLAHLCEQLEALPTERIRELLADLNGSDLVLATAPPLAAADEPRWLTRIADRLGNGARVRVIEDNSLIAGAELRFPHTTISACWRDGLNVAREELLRDVGPR